MVGRAFVGLRQDAESEVARAWATTTGRLAPGGLLVDATWARQAPQAAHGIRQRLIATAAAMRDAGWPLLDGPSPWRLGELTVAWDAVAPHQGP